MTKEQQAIKEDIWRAGDHDPVEHPEHYTSGGVECIKAIEASMEPVEYIGFLKGQVQKYMWRFEKKEKPLQDLKKARYYLRKLIEYLEEHKELEGIFRKSEQDFHVNIVSPTIEASTKPVEYIGDLIWGAHQKTEPLPKIEATEEE